MLDNANRNSWLGAGWRLDFGKVVNFFANGCVVSNWMSPGGGLDVLDQNGVAHDGSGVRVFSYVLLDPNHPNLNCTIPTKMATDLDTIYRATDPNTGQVTALWNHARTSSVNISYMEPSDFLDVDPNVIPPPSSYDYRRPAPPGEPADYYKEQTYAIQSVTDPFGRTITTHVTRIQATGFDKFLLSEVNAPVFGGAIGRWNLYYEVRQVTSPPPGWPIFDPATFPKMAFLVRVELPDDGHTRRLSYTFDYNSSGELTEIRTPSRAITRYTWGDERIEQSRDMTWVTAGKPRTRVIVAKTLYPDGLAGAANIWHYTHNQFATSATCPGLGIPAVEDPWRTIVTDPEGNDTEYRYYSPIPGPVRSTLGYVTYQGFELPGAIKYYKGRARLWSEGATCFDQLDPNSSGDGAVVRVNYFRYYPQDPNVSIAPERNLGSATIYVDDRLYSNANMRYDPNATWPTVAVEANSEMDLPLTVTDPDVMRFLEGYAWNAEVHDPNYFPWVPPVGTAEYETIRKGNLVGPQNLETLGDSSGPCPIHPLFGGDRQVYQGGTQVEVSQHWTGSGTSRYCAQRYDTSRTYTPADWNHLYSRDRQTYFERDAGERLTATAYSGGDPNATDPNSTSTNTLSYRQTVGYAYGTEASQAFDGVSWKSKDLTIDPSSGLPSSSRDPSGVQTTYAYDALGRIIAVVPQGAEYSTTVTFVAVDAHFTDAAGQTNTHTYVDWVNSARGPAGSTNLNTQYTYDGRGLLTREARLSADGSSIEQRHTYDGLGSPTFVSEWHVIATGFPPPTFPGTTISYLDGDSHFPPSGRRDPFSRPLKRTDPVGNVTDIRYFGLNDVVTVHGINGITSATTTTYRDYLGNVRIVDAPTGADALSDYDYAGRLTQVRLVPTYTPASYDPNSATTGLRADRFAATLPTFVQTRTFSRDTFGSVRSSREPEKGLTTNFFYDPLGNPMLTQDNAGRRTHLAYDPAGRASKIEVAGNASSPYRARQIYTYANDPASIGTHGTALSKLIRAETRWNLGTTTGFEREFTYNGLNGRLSKESDRYPLMWGANPPWVSTTYAYDNFGQPSQMTYPIPDGSVRPPMTIAYTYHHGFLAELDSNKSTTDPTVFTPLVNVDYSPQGLPLGLNFSNYVTELTTVDAASRPVSLSVSRASTPFWDSGTYSYDGAGNIVGIGPQVYHYDTIGRLTSSSTASMDAAPTLYLQTYAYDRYGSMTSRTSPSAGPVFGADANQIFTVDPNTNQVTAINPTTTNLEFKYDLDGSVTTDGVYSYFYNDQERQTQVTMQGDGSLLETYVSDDRGWRVRKTDNTQERDTVYFRGPDGLVLSEYSKPNGTSLVPHWRKDYVYALGRHLAAVENLEPDEPAGVISSSSRPQQPASVTISWLPVSGQDIYGYFAYRSTTDSNGPYNLFDIVTTPTVTDTLVASGVPTYYKLTAMDMAGNESRETAVRKITPSDITTPSPPTNFNGTIASQPGLTWQAPPDTDGDLAGYQLYRAVSEDPLTVFGTWLPVGSTSYTDTTADPNTTYVYQIRSFDTAGNESTSNPSVTITTPTPGGGGGGGDCGDHCIPPIDGLMLPHCHPPDSIERTLGAHDSFCMPGEAMEDLADHTGVEADYRIVFYHVDQLGTPRVLTDEMGNVISKHALYPFGEEVPGAYAIADSTNTHWFTGHERDLGVGGDYMLAREVPNSVARFSSPDPSYHNIKPGRSSSWNGYAYVENSPLSFVDPDGLGMLVVRGMRCFGGYLDGLVPHPVFVLDNGTTFQFGPGGVKADPYPDASAHYIPLIVGLDDIGLLAAKKAVQENLGWYNPVTNDCYAFADAVLEEYASKLLGKCKGGDVDACKELKKLCDQRFAPSLTCEEYNQDKKEGKLPAHAGAGFGPRLLVP